MRIWFCPRCWNVSLDRFEWPPWLSGFAQPSFGGMSHLLLKNVLQCHAHTSHVAPNGYLHLGVSGWGVFST